jgi:predicted DNA-binding protein
MDKDSLKPISLAVRVSQLERLKTLSDITGAPLAELIRRAIDMYLEERKSELKEGRR